MPQRFKKKETTRRVGGGWGICTFFIYIHLTLTAFNFEKVYGDLPIGITLPHPNKDQDSHLTWSIFKAAFISLS